MRTGDTIVAISTPPGRGGIGIVRLSGEASRAIVEAFIRLKPDWKPWTCQLGQLTDTDGSVADDVILSYFQAGRSYTFEDVVEISCHGSPVVLELCLRRAVQAGARLAEPGEFTLRAYINGRIDLVQAEAVRNLIDATTLYQAKVAVQQMEGSVSRRIKPIKEQLVELISLLEAGIDFAEDDVSVASPDEIKRRIALVEQPLRAALHSFSSGHLVFEGFTLAIAGRPNVGKSSLFNRLLEQDRSIVTAIPGTTRDTVSESTSIGGIPVRLVDTAGIRPSSDQVESLGIERSYQAMADADLSLLVFDLSEELTEDDRVLLGKLADRRPILVGNKCDLPESLQGVAGLIKVSAANGTGLDSLRSALLHALAPDGLAAPESGSITNLRHDALLRETLEALTNAARAVDYGIPHEMMLLDLYAALRPLDAITGATTADDILNRIFSTFCIGK